MILKVGWFSSAPWWSAACWLTSWSRPAGHDSKPSSALRKPRCRGVKHQGGWVPGEHGRKLLGTPEVRIPGIGKDLHDMMAEDDSNVYLVSKSVKENFFKSVETDEFIWKKAVMTHDISWQSPELTISATYWSILCHPGSSGDGSLVLKLTLTADFAVQSVSRRSFCSQKLFSGFYMIE